MVPTIMRKYQHMKCNLNNEIKSIYLSMTNNMHCCLFSVNCTDITMMRSLQPTEDPRMVNPNMLSKGIDEYFDVGNESAVFEFVCTYVRRIASDASWRKMMKMYPGTPVFNMITPSVNHQEREGVMGSDKETREYSRHKTRKEDPTTIQQGRGEEESEWSDCVEQYRVGVLLHDRENLEGSLLFQEIFETNQSMGEMGGHGQEQEGSYQDDLGT